ncbi:hypothetical protein RHMOL_Rhmol13G0198100 [Rhododendron molle]|uniref:Uncharacterized protein n=1 Tax=Rhododendron molle TaxID=49168 RepID=A0ACC0L924_RHOML|nr:hypothetical protein RHMOL_Rhmol13G0198100 [Rhododendron molle]
MITKGEWGKREFTAPLCRDAARHVIHGNPSFTFQSSVKGMGENGILSLQTPNFFFPY